MGFSNLDCQCLLWVSSVLELYTIFEEGVVWDGAQNTKDVQYTTRKTTLCLTQFFFSSFLRQKANKPTPNASLNPQGNYLHQDHGKGTI